MKIPRDVSVVTFIQFVTLSLLGIANGLNSVVYTCNKDSSDCVNNLLTSMIFFILTVIWFAFVWVLSYAVRDRRSKRLALVLIASELLIAMIAYFNARHHTDFLSLATSVIDLMLALWVTYLAFLIWRSKGGRVRTRQRARRRPETRSPKA
jgi:hypothetical protein